MGIAVYQVVYVRLDAQSLQTMTELICGMLSVIVGDDDAAHHEVATLELVTQSQHILVIGDA